METYSENNYYHASSGVGNRHENDRRNQLRDGDFGREYEQRYRNRDGRNRKTYDEYQQPNSMFRSNEGFGDNFSGRSEGRAQRGYGVGNTIRGGYGYDSDRNSSHRTPGNTNQGGYGTGYMGGYSGSAFGGSNYSSKGSFSGDDSYGSMSGGGGNMSRGASSSGYGNAGNRAGSSSWSNDPYRKAAGQPANNSYKGYGSNNNRNAPNAHQRQSDRGGYTDYDPNNRWNS